MGMVLHVPEVTELVLRTRRRPAGPSHLHGKAADHQADDQSAQRFRVAHWNPFGRVDPYRQGVLNDGPDCGVDGLLLRGVGQYPVRPGDALGQKIAVTGSIQRRWRAGDHVEVGQDRSGGRAVERLFRASIGDGCPVGGIPVHRGRSGDRHVRSAETVRDELGQVVDGPGPNGDRNGTARPDRVLQQLDERMLGIHIVGEEESIASDAGAEKAGLDVCSCRLKGPLVSRDHDCTVAEGGGEHVGGFVADPAVDREQSRVGCL